MAYQCPCPGQLQTEDERIEHIKLAHWDFVRCEICSQIVEGGPALTKHYYRHKKTDPQAKEMLKESLLKQRTGGNALLCIECGQTFDSKEGREKYNRHVYRYLYDE